MDFSASGPCLPHCYRCSPATRLFASAAIVYALSSVGYLVLTRCMGTPFYDSLTPAQLGILAEAKAKRSHAFVMAFMASIVAVAAWQPFDPRPAA